MDMLKTLVVAVAARVGTSAGVLHAALQPGDDIGTQALAALGVVLGLVFDVILEKRRQRVR